MEELWDFHTHTTMSDGDILPIELIRRMSVLGYTTIAITDHADLTNITFLIDSLSRLKPSAARVVVELLAGVEITHVPPEEIQGLAKEAKMAGADIVVVHGESPVEPVAPGTNRAACSCPDVNILAHPGLISLEDASFAAENGVFLEITSRGGHNRTNGHVLITARNAGCQIVIDSDAHSPGDLLDARAKELVGRGAGLTGEEYQNILDLNMNKIRRH